MACQQGGVSTRSFLPVVRPLVDPQKLVEDVKLGQSLVTVIVANLYRNSGMEKQKQTKQKEKKNKWREEGGTQVSPFPWPLHTEPRALGRAQHCFPHRTSRRWPRTLLALPKYSAERPCGESHLWSVL